MKDIISFLSTTNVNIVNSWRAAHCPGCRAGERGLNWIFFYKFIFSFMVRLSIGCFSFVCLFPPGARGWPCSRNLALARLPASCSTEPWPRCMIVIFQYNKRNTKLTHGLRCHAGIGCGEEVGGVLGPAAWRAEKSSHQRGEGGELAYGRTWENFSCHHMNI